MEKKETDKNKLPIQKNSITNNLNNSRVEIKKLGQSSQAKSTNQANQINNLQQKNINESGSNNKNTFPPIKNTKRDTLVLTSQTKTQQFNGFSKSSFSNQNTKKNININDIQKNLNLSKDELAQVMYNYGVKFYQSDKKRAEVYFLEYLKLKPENINAYYNLGLIYGEIGEKAKAIDYYNEVLKRNPEHRNALYNSANEYIFLGLYDNAEVNYQKINMLDSEPYDSVFNLGILYLEFKKDYTKAIETFFYLMKLFPKNTENFFYIALSYDLLEDYDNAIKYYQESISSNPNDYKSIFNLASVYNKTLRMKKALNLFINYLEIPDKPMKEYINVQYARRRVKELKSEGL
jgi:tetratricopeptide (TPR) repeat protein